jgi:hypothetical protein
LLFKAKEFMEHRFIYARWHIADRIDLG